MKKPYTVTSGKVYIMRATAPATVTQIKNGIEWVIATHTGDSSTVNFLPSADYVTIDSEGNVDIQEVFRGALAAVQGGGETPTNPFYTGLWQEVHKGVSAYFAGELDAGKVNEVSGLTDFDLSEATFTPVEGQLKEARIAMTLEQDASFVAWPDSWLWVDKQGNPTGSAPNTLGKGTHFFQLHAMYYGNASTGITPTPVTAIVHYLSIPAL